MSDDDTISPAEGGKLIAAEYVLGVLGAEERREVERRLLTEPALAADVAFWEARLGALTDTVAPVEPSPELWRRIETAVGPSPASPPRGLWQNLAFWRVVGIGSAALAAASIVALAYLGTVPSARVPLMATLGGAGGQPNFVAAVSADGTSITVVPAALLTNDPRAIELWLIPSRGGRPHSLGLIQPGSPIRLVIPPEVIGQITPDATLAVSLEPPGGSPTGQPTGPVIASGKLTSL
jgi:anti-sigma-K factor RskA